jgi:hypothetical protein
MRRAAKVGVLIDLKKHAAIRDGLVSESSKEKGIP